VVDLFLRAHIRAGCKPILIHGGDEASVDGGWHRVPKRELVSTAQACSAKREVEAGG
jgi:hypothetical protein